MEEIAIGDMMETVAAMIIGAGAIVLVILAAIVVVAVGWFIQASR